MEESENGRTVFSQPAPSFRPHETSLLTPAFLLFAPVCLCPLAVLLSPSHSLLQSCMCSQIPLPHVLLFQPELLCPTSFHTASFLLAPCSHGRKMQWWCYCMSRAMQSDGEVHQRGQEELSGDVGTGDVPAWWSWLGRCAQLWGRRDGREELRSAVACRGWDGILRLAWKHCAGCGEEVMCMLWGALRGVRVEEQGPQGTWHDAEALLMAKQGEALAAKHVMPNIIKSLIW